MAGGSCDYTDYFVGDDDVVDLPPGVYCGGITVDSNATVNFEEGNYVIQDGPLEVLSNGTINGPGTGFYLTGDDSTIFFDSNSTINLSAPTSGDLAGVVFYQDRESDGTHRIDSNSVTKIEGVMYFPNGDFVSDSNSSISGIDSPCTMLFAQNIELNSNASFDLSWDLEECNVPIMANASGNGIALRR